MILCCSGVGRKGEGNGVKRKYEVRGGISNCCRESIGHQSRFATAEKRKWNFHYVFSTQTGEKIKAGLLSRTRRDSTTERVSSVV